MPTTQKLLMPTTQKLLIAHKSKTAYAHNSNCLCPQLKNCLCPQLKTAYAHNSKTAYAHNSTCLCPQLKTAHNSKLLMPTTQKLRMPTTLTVRALGSSDLPSLARSSYCVGCLVHHPEGEGVGVLCSTSVRFTRNIPVNPVSHFFGKPHRPCYVKTW